jgi:gamma-glutamyl hercynylcysteine S-oxide synthase
VTTTDEAGTKQRFADELDRVRARSLGLTTDVLDVNELLAQHSRLMSPLVWDLAHVGNYEELWLLRAAAGIDPMRPEIDDIYDAFEHPRVERPTLPLLQPDEAQAYLNVVRAKVLDSLDRVRFDPSNPLLDNGFVYGMVVQHEHQHDETLLATIQLMDDYAHPDADGRVSCADSDGPRATEDILVPAGSFTMGTDRAAWAYDNERPAHEESVDAFRIDTTPVTNHAYVAFVEGGGYDDRASWTAEGWRWRTEAGLQAPQFWSRAEDGTWTRRRFGRDEPLPPTEPVQHVCWYEADAYARWSGARLPTEIEWEYASLGSSAAAANLWTEGDHRWSPAPVGSRVDNRSRWGVSGMLGDVWEWTASDFTPYPGFRAFPYREYSEVFFGPEYGPEYKVLRGGSWATHPQAVRTTFRNWDYPIRRQIFAGFRCARAA